MSDTLTDRTLLVTGGAGFVGGHLVDALVADNEVRVLDDLSTGTAARLPADAELIEGDVRDPDALATAMRGVDVAFHLAAMVSVPDSIERPRECHAINATGTTRVLDRARRTDTRVVVASSAAVYGDPESVPIPETAATRPRSPYGVAKLAGDHQARVFADQYDLPVVSLRYFNVYGPRARPGEAGVVGQFVTRALAGDPLVVQGDGEQTRDFVHVTDVVAANLLAATTDHTGEAFNVGTGRAISIRRLAKLVAAVVDADVEIVHAEPRSGDVRSSRADVSKARDRLGYEPSTDLESGLADLVARRSRSGTGTRPDEE